MIEAKILPMMSIEAYHAHSEISSSDLKTITTESPRAYQLQAQNKRTTTAAKAVGTAIHMAVLEPGNFKHIYRVWGGGDRRGKKWKRFEYEAKDARKLVITEKELDACLGAARVVHQHPVAGPLFKGSRKEVSLVWTDERTGIECRARIDSIGSVLAELKSTKSASTGLFATDAAKYAYDLQMAFYSDGWAAVTGEVPPVKIVAVEKSPPYDVRVFSLSEQFLAAGVTRYQEALDTLKKCRQTCVWPGRWEKEETELHLPEWAKPEQEARVFTEGGKEVAL